MVGKNGNYNLHELSDTAGLRTAWLNAPIARYVKIALDNGANPNQLNRSGHSPLMILLSKSNYCTEDLEAVDVLLANHANPTLGGPSGNLPLYQAIGQHSIPLARKLFHADVKYRLEGRANWSHDHTPSPDHPWWQKWETTIMKTNWDDAKGWLRNSLGIPPPGGDRQINTIALGVLAERCFEMAKDEFKRNRVGRGEHCSYIAKILRDCRQFSIEVDPECYDYLLNLL
jgi:hypothetical protein